jgi:protein-S-isoprenylcysteine O-methyltransferase Ste14
MFARFIGAAVAIVGLGALLWFAVFLATGGFNLIDVHLRFSSVLAWDAVLCFVFFVQHSGMIRHSFQNKLSGALPSGFHAALYTIASGAALLLLTVCWQPSHVKLAEMRGAGVWVMRSVLISCLAGFVWAIRSLANFDPFGSRAIIARARREKLSPAPLSIKGPYRWVRHPLYFLCIVAIWAWPILSADRLLFNVLFTAWIIVGTLLEERDLSAQFGDPYRQYQCLVPMLLPRPPRRGVFIAGVK